MKEINNTTMKTKNELIAEFMGFSVVKKMPQAGAPEARFILEKNLKYHTSWDWLMPVVIKCHEIGDAKEKEFPESKHLDDPTGWKAWSYRRVGLSTNIQQVYKNVITFITWLNLQPKQ